jgi:hypothetical protein
LVRFSERNSLPADAFYLPSTCLQTLPNSALSAGRIAGVTYPELRAQAFSLTTERYAEWRAGVF